MSRRRAIAGGAYWAPAVAGLVAACLLAASGPAQARGEERRCGEIVRVGEAGAELSSVRARGTRCETARWAFEHLRAAAAQGWHCHSAGSEGACTKGAGSISYNAARGVRRCGRVAFAENSEDGTGTIVAAHIGCRTSRDVARGSRDFGPSSAFAYRARGFTCRSGPLLQGGLISRLVSCRRGQAIVGFERF
jgi:hypothetical protein